MPVDPATETDALRRFVEGFAALATELVLDGILALPQPALDPATYIEPASVAA